MLVTLISTLTMPTDRKRRVYVFISFHTCCNKLNSTSSFDITRARVSSYNAIRFYFQDITVKFSTFQADIWSLVGLFYLEGCFVENELHFVLHFVRAFSNRGLITGHISNIHFQYLFRPNDAIQIAKVWLPVTFFFWLSNFFKDSLTLHSNKLLIFAKMSLFKLFLEANFIEYFTQKLFGNQSWIRKG